MRIVPIRLCVGVCGLLLLSAAMADSPPKVDSDSGFTRHYEKLPHAKTLARAKQVWPMALVDIKGEKKSVLQCETYEMRIPQTDIDMLKNARSHKIIAASWGRTQSRVNEMVSMAIKIPDLKNKTSPMFAVTVSFEQSRCVRLSVDYSWSELKQTQ